MLGTSSRRQYKERKEIVKRNMNKGEWTRELDQVLMQSVIRNYFNFAAVAQELNHEATQQRLDFGATNIYTSEKCRFRWSYLHLQRKLGKSISYRPISPSATASEAETDKENRNHQNGHRVSQKSSEKKKKKWLEAETQQQGVLDPKGLLDAKDFSGITERKEPKTMADIEASLWKQNIKHGPRVRKDFLDTSMEDFTLNKSKGIDGTEITPSCFNIARDSLRVASERLQETLNEHLPDMNLRDIEETASEGDEEVLPLDFRTALIANENRVVIQAKPLEFKIEIDDEKQESKPSNISLDGYLEMVKKEPFREDEGAIMLYPEINIEEKFDKIKLPCDKETRINNTIDAPIRSARLSNPSGSKKKGPKMPLSNKTYETDTDNQASDAEQSRHSVQSWQSDHSQSKSKQKQASKTLDQAQLPQSFQTAAKNEDLKPGAVADIIQKNREALEKMEQDAANMHFTQDAMMDELDDLAKEEPAAGSKEKAQTQQEHTEDSDVAPVSPFADVPDPGELKRMAEEEREARFLEAVKAVSSASETDDAMSGTEGKGKARKMKAKIESPRLSLTQQSSSKSSAKKKQRYYKGMPVMSDTEDGGSPQKKAPSSKQRVLPAKDDNDSSGSRSSHGSADEYFAATRNAVRQKLNIKSSKPSMGLSTAPSKSKPAPSDDKTKQDDEESESSSEDDDAYNKRLEEERKKQQDMILKKKAEAARTEERARTQRLQEQQAMIASAQEKKRKEKEELMQKLKKQDEERKRRKREEREKKEREAKRYQEMLDATRREKEAEMERERERQKEQEEAEYKEKKKQELIERKKTEWETTLLSEKTWEEAGKSDFPSLFDKRCSFMSIISSLPLFLEDNIVNKNVPLSDLTFRRYKTLLIPLDSHITLLSQSLLIQYFLQYSTMYKVYSDEQNSPAVVKECFPFKCIGMQTMMVKTPLCKPSLLPPTTDDVRKGKQTAQRVIAIMLDTSDEPKTKKINIKEILDTIKLDTIFPKEELEWMKEHYSAYIKGLALKHFRSKSLKEFPYPLKSCNEQIVDFENSDDGLFDISTAALSKLVFFAEYTWQDGIPAKTDESWELFRRCPQFFAFNMDKPSYTRIAVKERKKDGLQIVSKKNQFKYENVCVVLKDLSFDPVVQTKAQSSLAYLLQKACCKNGLDICGVRLAYLGEKQREEYYQLFHENLNQGLAGPERPVLAILFRGLEASKKIESILGHFNPELARRTEKKSLRACFGRSKTQNCVMHIFDHGKSQLDYKFWFGGRLLDSKLFVQSETTKKSSIAEQYDVHLVTPGPIEKQLLFLSPYITSGKLPAILRRLAALGVTLLNIQKIQYSKFQYESGNIDRLKREAIFEIRGKKITSDVGFVLEVCRVDLASHFRCQEKELQQDLDELLAEHAVADLMFMTSSCDEYQRVRHILKKDTFKTHYINPYADRVGQVQDANAGSSTTASKRDRNYDSEDPEQYKDLQLYTGKLPQGPRISYIKPVKSKEEATREMQEKYQMSTCVCFIKISSFKKQVVGETIHAILNLIELELLGLRIVDAKRELDIDCVPKEVRKIVKCMAYKFHQMATEIKLRKKIDEFKTFALVLRGQDIQGQLDKIYDRQKMKFLPEVVRGLDNVDYDATPHVLFLTNPSQTAPLLDFFFQSQYIQMYQDIKESFNHLNNSVHFTNLVSLAARSGEGGSTETAKIARIKKVEDLLDDQLQRPASLSGSLKPKSNICSGICIIKPNQPIHVILRTLKSIANLNPDALAHSSPSFVRISKIEAIASYSPSQLDLLFAHEIDFDATLHPQTRAQYKPKHKALLASQPALQLAVHGEDALAKLKALVGSAHQGRGSTKGRHHFSSEKDQLRSFYGVDRVDNAYFVSETVEEAVEEERALFGEGEQKKDNGEGEQQERLVVALKEEEKTADDSKAKTAIGSMLLQGQMELALIVISPTLVQNNDFVYVMDDFHRAKFGLCAIKKRPLANADLRALFGDLQPKVHNIVVLEKEFTKGDAVLLVFEKAKAIESAQALVGKFGIKVSSDFELKKISKKAAAQQYVSKLGMGGSSADDFSLMREYGSYIFCFPNADLNQSKIAKEFTSLPFSRHFKLQPSGA